MIDEASKDNGEPQTPSHKETVPDNLHVPTDVPTYPTLDTAAREMAEAAARKDIESQLAGEKDHATAERTTTVELTKAENAARMREGISEVTDPLRETLTYRAEMLDGERNVNWLPIVYPRQNTVRAYTEDDGKKGRAYELRYRRRKEGKNKFRTPAHYRQALSTRDVEEDLPVEVPHIDVQFRDGSVSSVGITWYTAGFDMYHGKARDPKDFHIAGLEDKHALIDVISLPLFSDTQHAGIQTLRLEFDGSEPRLVYEAPGEESRPRIGKAEYHFNPAEDTFVAGKVGRDWIKPGDRQHITTRDPHKITSYREFTMSGAQYRTVLGEMVSLIPRKPIAAA